MDEIIKLDFLTDINYIRIFIGVIILFISTKCIEYVYNNFTHSNDNKLLFVKQMFPFVIAIFFIVSVIKSSIALSLGLVGALSIIRFRTAIKEPSQLITLLILTSLSISVAAEKELLGLLITFIFVIHTILSNKNQNIDNDNFATKKLLRISVKDCDINISDLVKIKNIERIYSDVNKIIHLEFFIISSNDELDPILEKVKSHGEIITYELL
tara:strand:- start:58 stop:693 length:636 start_codon:yes stop_codon:yes gene_type:complete